MEAQVPSGQALRHKLSVVLVKEKLRDEQTCRHLLVRMSAQLEFKTVAEMLGHTWTQVLVKF